MQLNLTTNMNQGTLFENHKESYEITWNEPDIAYVRNKLCGFEEAPMDASGFSPTAVTLAKTIGNIIYPTTTPGITQNNVPEIVAHSLDFLNAWYAIQYPFERRITENRDFIHAIGCIGRLAEIVEKPILRDKLLGDKRFMSGIQAIVKKMTTAEASLIEFIQRKPVDPFFYRSMTLYYHTASILQSLLRDPVPEMAYQPPVSMEKAARNTGTESGQILSTVIDYFRTHPLKPLENIPPQLTILIVISDLQTKIDLVSGINGRLNAKIIFDNNRETYDIEGHVHRTIIVPTRESIETVLEKTKVDLAIIGTDVPKNGYMKDELEGKGIQTIQLAIEPGNTSGINANMQKLIADEIKKIQASISSQEQSPR